MKRAVVIGSGIGGLTAARLLQRRGLRVTVLEQHYRPGGMLHRFYRPGAAFDTGFHYCGGIAPGDALGQALRHLGVFDQLAFHALDPAGFDVLRFPDLEFRVPVGWEAYEERLCSAFPSAADGVATVLRRMRAAVDAYGLYRMRSDTDPAAVLAAEGCSLASVLSEHVADPRARAILAGQAALYGVPPDDAPFGMHSLILDHFLRGAHTLDGGGDRLVLKLVRAIRADGGEVRLRTRATAVSVRDGRADGVHAGAEFFPAEAVVSNLHPRLTLALLPPEATRPAYKSRVAETGLGHAHFGAYLRVAGRVESLGNANFYGHPTWDTTGAYRSLEPGSAGLYFASAPSEHTDTPDSQHGTALLLFPMRWSQVSAWANRPYGDRDPAYEDYKSQLLATALDRFVADHPSLRGRIVSAEASTPLSTAHFTESPEGATFGHYHSVAQMGRYRPAQAIRVPNVRLVGQGVFSPGILGATLSAYYAVGHLFGELDQLLAELRAA